MPQRVTIPEVIPYVAADLPLVMRWSRSAPNAKRHGFAFHKDIEFHFVLRGSLVYAVRDKRYRLRPGSLLVIPPNEPHVAHPAEPSDAHPAEPDDALEKITLIVHPSLIDRPDGVSLDDAAAHRHTRLSSDETAKLIEIATSIRSEIDNRDLDWAVMCRLKIRELIVLCRRAFANPVPAAAGDPAIEQAIAYIEGHYHEHIDNQTLAATTGTSASRLMHRFKSHMGIGIKQYVLLLRVAKAGQILIADPDLKVEYIARTVGFNYFADFNRTFKRHTGMTPTAYRTAGTAGRQVPASVPDRASAPPNAHETTRTHAGDEFAIPR